ncbi:MAG: hypothetical protein HYY52_04045 [Candidatus Melainabacteria bacterium]|nr:hypothetical protein [Candidatus Melainabacteria bacterium]
MLEINFTLVLFALSFLVFIYLLNLTLYKPVGTIVEARKNLINGEYKRAKELTENANKILEDYNHRIKEARKLAHNTIEESITQASSKKEEKISILVSDLNKEKEGALKQLEKDQKEALKALEGEIKVLTDLITNKILGTEKNLVRTN